MFEVFTTLLLTTQVYWDEKLCCWESGFWHSKGLICLHFQVPTVQEEWTAWPWILKSLKVPHSFKMSRTTCPMTRPYPRRLESYISYITTNKYKLLHKMSRWKRNWQKVLTNSHRFTRGRIPTNLIYLKNVAVKRE
jgi:hypothetical protein